MIRILFSPRWTKISSTGINGRTDGRDFSLKFDKSVIIDDILQSYWDLKSYDYAYLTISGGQIIGIEKEKEVKKNE